MVRALEEISLIEVRNERQIGAQEESLAQFTSIRALSAGTGVLSVGTRAQKPASAALNDEFLESDTGWRYRFSGTAWLYSSGIAIGTNATRAAITVTANDNGALFYTSDTKLLWRVAAGAWAQSDITPAAHKDLHKSGGTDAFTSSDLLEAIVKRIQTSSGPTTLTVGAIADGEFLKRVGTDIVSAAVSGFAVLVSSPTWTAPSFLNSWVNDASGLFNTAGYYKDQFGRVYLRGLVKTGTVGLPIFNLPAGFRPAKENVFATVSNGVFADARVEPDGDVVAAAGSNVWFSLDGISFAV